MITTAGNGPGPSGFDRVIGICSENPLGAVVVMDGPESVPPQPLRAAAQSPSAISLSARRRLTMRRFYSGWHLARLTPPPRSAMVFADDIQEATSRTGSMNGALSGIRVVDITNNQAGPSCGQMLAWLGADVIKVEEPIKGDPARSMLKDRPDADSLFYLSFNGNKRSLTLNLKNSRAKDVFRTLLRTADVLLENFGPGVLERLGFGYPEVRALNPRLVRSEEHTSELQSLAYLVCRLLLEKKKKKQRKNFRY